VLLEFMLDQKRHPIDILDRPERVPLELGSDVFGRVRRSADQRPFVRLQLHPRRGPHAGDQQQAERGQAP